MHRFTQKSASGFLDPLPRNPLDRPLRRYIPFPVKAIWLFLAAITIFGKGPTYLIYPPFYWGELTMGLGLLWMLWGISNSGFPARMSNPCSLLILGFMFTGLALLLPSISRYGMLAVRDSAIWYYGIFFFIGLYITSLPQVAEWLWQKLIVTWGLAMLWTLVMRSTKQILLEKTPFLILPWRGVHVLSGSSSENMQHMALGALLLGMGILWKRPSAQGYLLIIFAGLWSLVVLFSAHGRAVKLAVLAAILVILLATLGTRRRLFPTSRWLVAGYLTLLAVALFAVVAGPKGVKKLILSKGQFGRFEDVATKKVKGTARWRSEWWHNIYDEVMETAPLTGLGFGANLGEFNPYLTRFVNKDKWKIRSPHNINVTVFGKMGIVGATFWLAILMVGFGRLFVRVRLGNIHGRPYTEARHKELAFWLAMLVATFVNSSLGVLMEGPVLGIWFWFALGFSWGRAMGEDAVEPHPPGRDFSVRLMP